MKNIKNRRRSIMGSGKIINQLYYIKPSGLPAMSYKIYSTYPVHSLVTIKFTRSTVSIYQNKSESSVGAVISDNPTITPMQDDKYIYV